MSKLLDEKVEDTGAWWCANRDRLRDLEKTVEFLTTAVQCLIEQSAIIAKDLQTIERRPGSSSTLYLPGRMTVRGDVRTFG